MTLNVHLIREPEDEVLAYLIAHLHPELHLTFGSVPANPERVEVLIAGRPDRDLLEACQNLRALVVPFAGLPEETQQVLQDFPNLAIHNLHHNATPTAEMAAALLLAAAKFLIPMDRAMRSHDWRPRYHPNPSVLLEGKTALILGYGAIGQKVSRICQGLGMRVLAVRRSSPSEAISQDIEIQPVSALATILPLANVLIICLPLTQETKGLINARALELLPEGAILINVARGPVVDEKALYDALREGRLYAAGLDVWYQYPEDEGDRSHSHPSKYPFHELDNVVMSPHRAGGSQETKLLRMHHLADLLNRLVEGKEMPNRVDLLRGY
ncbi:MAG: hydroxyacid dehydrogenase [Anaerolineales bacterium]|nr:hydroxyacid dehydrogenase [Anaerolineales bacterium]